MFLLLFRRAFYCCDWEATATATAVKSGIDWNEAERGQKERAENLTIYGSLPRLSSVCRLLQHP